jgi:hypothetical protein
LGIAEFESTLRLILALLPTERPGGVIDGDWEDAIRRLPEVMATSINLMPTPYQARAIQAVRDRLVEY